ncbi:MAG TPA: gamma-glutamylcyclotransferase family protein [Nitrosospira sp.]
MLNKSTHTFLYFAYGANMFSRRLKESIAPSAVAIDIGYVEGRRFSFGKVSRDGSGKCDIEVTNNPNDRAYGVLYRINVKEKSNLGKAEGLGIGYSEANIQIVTATGTHTATTYVASYKEPVLRPYQWYKALVIAGAVEHGLPAQYCEWLRTFEAQADANAERRTEREAQLFGNLSLNNFKADVGLRQAVNEV